MGFVILGQGDLADRCVRWLRERGDHPVAVIADPLTVDWAEQCGAGFAFSIGYRHILSPATLAAFPKGVLNLHTSYLPYGRGAHPNVWAIVEGTPAGVTIHRMDAGVDTGPIVEQVAVDVLPWDTGGSLWGRLQDAAFGLFIFSWQTHHPDWPQGMPQPVLDDAYLRLPHRQADLDTATLGTHPNAAYRAMLNVLRARTFPGYPGIRYKDGGHWVEATINLKPVDGP